MVSDAAVLRFLIARKFDVAKTVALILESTKFRNENGFDSILDSPRSDVLLKIADMYPCCWHGFDKRGLPIYIEYMGNLDIHTISHETSFEDTLYFHRVRQEFSRRKICALATARTALTGTPRRIDHSVAIMDLAGLGRKQCRKAAYTFLSTIAKQDSICFPESLAETWIINAGFFFAAAYAVVRPFLDERTTSKFKIYRSDAKKEMCAALGAENLPPMYGGTYVGGGTDMTSVIQNAPGTAMFRYMLQHGNAAFEAKYGRDIVLGTKKSGTEAKSSDSSASAGPSADKPEEKSALPVLTVAPSSPFPSSASSSSIDGVDALSLRSPSSSSSSSRVRSGSINTSVSRSRRSVSSLLSPLGDRDFANAEPDLEGLNEEDEDDYDEYEDAEEVTDHAHGVPEDDNVPESSSTVTSTVTSSTATS